MKPREVRWWSWGSSQGLLVLSPCFLLTSYLCIEEEEAENLGTGEEGMV